MGNIYLGGTSLLSSGSVAGTIGCIAKYATDKNTCSGALSASDFTNGEGWYNVSLYLVNQCLYNGNLYWDGSYFNGFMSAIIDSDDGNFSFVPNIIVNSTDHKVHLPLWANTNY